MAGNNLRIISENLADSATITALSEKGTLVASNLKLDAKGKVWRTNATNDTSITVSWGTAKTIYGVILAFTNLTPTAQIKIVSGALDTGYVDACPWTSIVPYGAETIPSGANTFAYGGGTHARCWIPANLRTSISSCVVHIKDAGVSEIEVSRLIIGEAWEPKYNTSFGISMGVKDLSTMDRLTSGDLYTTRGTKSNTLTFDLKYMNASDRSSMLSILRKNGTYKPVFASIFPEDAEANKERDYQIYGKLSQLDAIVHPIFDMYSTQVTLEEI